VAAPAGVVRGVPADGASPVPGLDRGGVWPKLRRAILDLHGAAGDIDWSAAIVDAASVRAKRGAS
jgi:hypothetical protein